MAIEWGSYEGPSGGLQIRVGIEVSWTSGTGGPIGHNAGTAKATVEYYTENHFTWGDDQSLNLGGAIDGSINFHNGQGEAATKRGERTYTYDYGTHEYGESPANRTFSASLSGAFNGITPSKSVTKAIPARPYGEPVMPGNASATRISDSDAKVSWVNNSTSGEPYGSVVVERRRMEGGLSGAWSQVARTGASASSFTDTSVIANRQYIYRVKSANMVGDSAWNETGSVYTTPATPSAVLRTTSGANQVVSWTDQCDYLNFSTQVWHAANGVWDSSPLFTAPAGDEDYTHTAPSAGIKHKYRVRTKTTAGPTLYSAYSAETTETAGTTSAPGAPTNLAPASSTVVDPTAVTVLSWTHNPTDGSAQTKYQVQHRLVGAGSWTTLAEIPSSGTSHTLAENSYVYSQSVEWQVRTWGGDATLPSAYSATAVYVTSPAVAKKYPLLLDVTTGRVEASSAAVIPTTQAGKAGSVNVTGLQTQTGHVDFPVAFAVAPIVVGYCTQRRWVANAVGDPTTTGFDFRVQHVNDSTAHGDTSVTVHWIAQV